MEFKGTKGKWKVAEDTFVSQVRTDIDLICVVGHEDMADTEIEANAKLIAAAPELLEALQLLLAAYRSTEDDDFWNKDPEQKAEAAINKALHP